MLMFLPISLWLSGFNSYPLVSYESNIILVHYMYIEGEYSSAHLEFPSISL